ncbi:hypothetical protein AX17_002327 [Amanita inopinata Kibby_2008]|nr:hypothetical protein AX17_002327 [Amanita inopinata Kibby_2008]
MEDTLDQPHSYLDCLNYAQRRAVEHPQDVPLQILAGPGSGKTKVLTSRIAHLILKYKRPSSSICAVTFTNKAANEMKERLTKILGKQRVSEVKVGTFHALCAVFLRKYAHIVGLEPNFSICDAEESKKLIGQFLKGYNDVLASRNMTLKEGTIMSAISKAKARSTTADQFATDIQQKHQKTSCTPENLSIQETIIAEIYQEYEKLLRRSNSLDFDDLLLFGVRMFKMHKEAATWCRHILVDEFQDTNIIQYDLMRTIAYSSCVTIVGDPDQSIYGWRSAEIGNLAKMREDFPGTQQIFLEENYRSTAAILRASLAIVAQDKTRIQKSLFTSHPSGKTPSLQCFQTEREEAAFIPVEIKRLAAYTGGLLRWGDFAILLRFNALSRAIESALQKEGIPCRILGGHRFFERVEVKDLLAYLHLVDNSDFYPAFVRAVNTPSRGIGEKTLVEIGSRADKSRISHLKVVEKIYDGKAPDIKPALKRKVGSFIMTIRTLRDLATARTSPADILRRLIELIDYMDHLRKTQLDWETRWENVQELITFASEVDVDGLDTGPSKQSQETPLRLFLQASSLSSEGDNDTADNAEGRVTISTCHAAKGLEWPIVMIPSVDDGTFPFSRSDDVEEERRLLYVACTRAQGLLYLSYAQKRNVAGITRDRHRSTFISAVVGLYPDVFTDQIPQIDSNDRAVIAGVLHRAVPDEESAAHRIAEFNDTMQERWNDEAATDEPECRHTIPAKNTAPVAIPSFAASSQLLPTNGLKSSEAMQILMKVETPNVVSNLETESMPSRQLSSPFTAPSRASVVGSESSTRQQSLSNRFTVVSASTTCVTCDSAPVLTLSSRKPRYLSTQATASDKVHQQSNADAQDGKLQASQIQHTHARSDQDIAASKTSSTISSDKSDTISHSLAETEKQGLKRRLGMGRRTGGYTNKKFKLPC